MASPSAGTVGTVHALHPTFKLDNRYLFHFHRQPYCLGIIHTSMFTGINLTGLIVVLLISLEMPIAILLVVLAALCAFDANKQRAACIFSAVCIVFCIVFYLIGRDSDWAHSRLLVFPFIGAVAICLFVSRALLKKDKHDHDAS